MTLKNSFERNFFEFCFDGDVFNRRRRSNLIGVRVRVMVSRCWEVELKLEKRISFVCQKEQVQGFWKHSLHNGHSPNLEGFKIYML